MTAFCQEDATAARAASSDGESDAVVVRKNSVVKNLRASWTGKRTLVTAPNESIWIAMTLKRPMVPVAARV